MRYSNDNNLDILFNTLHKTNDKKMNFHQVLNTIFTT